MPRHLDASTEAQMAQIIVQYGRPSRSSWKESVRSPSGTTLMGKAIWENYFGTRLGKSFELGMFICQPSKRTILICERGRYQDGRQNRKHETDEENSDERRWFGRTILILRLRKFGFYSKRVYNKYLHCDKLQGYVRSQDFCWSRGKTTYKSIMETWCRNHIFLVLRHGRSCKEMCGQILRTCEQNYSTITLSRNTMHGWPSIQRRGKWASRRIVYSLLTNKPQKTVFGSYWETWKLGVLWTNLLVR